MDFYNILQSKYYINCSSGDILTFQLSLLYILMLDDKSKILEWKTLIKEFKIQKIDQTPANAILYQYIKKYIEHNYNNLIIIRYLLKYRAIINILDIHIVYRPLTDSNFLDY